MDKKDTKIGLNLPALKKAGGNLVAKKDSKGIKEFNLESSKKKASVEKILKTDSIKAQMKQEQKKRSGLDLVLVGDLTGSMSAYYRILKDKFKEICESLFQFIPNLRIGIIFYLDHGSGDVYVTKTKQLSVNIQELQAFIDSTPCGNGGDADEAVEDALFEVLNLNWSELNKKSVVLFGDARAHEPNECDKGHDYFELTKKLYNLGVTINTVYCNPSVDYKSLSDLYKIEPGDFSTRVSRLYHDAFFSWIANVTGGIAIGVEQIDDLVDIIKGMAAKDAGKIDELEEENLKITKKEIPALKFIKQKAKQIEDKRLKLGYDKD